MNYKRLLLINIIYFLVVTLVLFYIIHVVWLEEQGFWLPLFLGSMNLSALSLMGLDKVLAVRNSPLSRVPRSSKSEVGRGGRGVVPSNKRGGSAQQRRGVFRVPELFFYIISIIGASTGVLIGALVFRHKTQKLRFVIILALILFLQIFAAAFLRQS